MPSWVEKTDNCRVKFASTYYFTFYMFPAEFKLQAWQDFRKKPCTKLVLSPVKTFHSGYGKYILIEIKPFYNTIFYP